jgi:hypothetical protein
MAHAILGVLALSCGMPSPSHHGFSLDWAEAATRSTAGARVVIANPLIRFLREISDLIIGGSHESYRFRKLEFFHRAISCVQALGEHRRCRARE